MYTLIAAVVLIFVGTTAGFYFAQDRLKEFAASITQLNADAEVGDKEVSTLQQLEKELEENQKTIKAARAIVSESKQYAYQDQIVADITAIANKSGVSITAFNFEPAGAEAGATTATPAPAAGGDSTAAGSPPGVPSVPNAASSAKVKSVVTNVTLSSPVRYNNLIEFIRAIELNRMKMQIAKVSLTTVEGGLSAETFAIEVYVRWKTKI